VRNIIFVDIDGVLLPGKMHLFDRNRKAVSDFLAGSPEGIVPYFDPIAVRIFQLWALHSSAQIVLCTNWAFGDDRRIDFVKHIMKSNGLDFQYHASPVTPRRLTSNKLHNVGLWIDDYGQAGDTYLVVDDDSSLYYLNSSDARVDWLQANQRIAAIIPNYDDGLTWKHFKDGCTHLQIDKKTLLQLEFGIVPRTPEEIERDKTLSYAFF
jgi:hypothetical protein